MKHFTITLTSRDRCAEYSVIAPNTVAAIRIGIGMMPAFGLPCAVTGKLARAA